MVLLRLHHPLKLLSPGGLGVGLEGLASGTLPTESGMTSVAKPRSEKSISLPPLRTTAMGRPLCRSPGSPKAQPSQAYLDSWPPSHESHNLRPPSLTFNSCPILFSISYPWSYTASQAPAAPASHTGLPPERTDRSMQSASLSIPGPFRSSGIIRSQRRRPSLAS
jgi:hypothetical protein